jgi:hypothetical protein
MEATARLFVPSIALNVFAGEKDTGGAARALAVFRIVLGLTLLVQNIFTARALPLLAGEFGLMQHPINAAVAPSMLPELTWFRGLWQSGLVSELHLMYAFFAAYCLALFYVTAGYRTPLFAAIALWLHLLFNASGFASIYGAHELATNGLFFCMLLPVSSCLTLTQRQAPIDDAAVRRARIVLRVYLTIVYVSSGVQKLAGEAWRKGDAVWNFLMRPEVTIADFGWLSGAMWLATIAAWFVLATELGYVVCIVSATARPVYLAATTLLHLGIALTLHLWFFSLVMIALNIGALAGNPLHWRRLLAPSGAPWLRYSRRPAGTPL